MNSPHTDRSDANAVHWVRLVQRMAPSLTFWMFTSVVAAGVMLYTCPVQASASWFASTGAVILAFLVFLFGWMAGMATFALSCESFRRATQPASLSSVLPLQLGAAIGLGLVGGGFWWLFAPVMAFVAHRKATQRMWWVTVTNVAWVLRTGMAGLPPVAQTDEEALAKAIAEINSEIRRPPDRLV